MMAIPGADEIPSSGIMSLEDIYYAPTTPPGLVDVPLIGSAHSRNASASSVFSYESSPDSAVTCVTTPSGSPHHQHGPTLLPKIRPQDVVA